MHRSRGPIHTSFLQRRFCYRQLYSQHEEAALAGKELYARHCLSCHGPSGKGTGNVPSLVDGRLDAVTPGELFWFITRGDKNNGMPAWASLPRKQRWQIVTYIKLMGTSR